MINFEAHAVHCQMANTIIITTIITVTANVVGTCLVEEPRKSTSVVPEYPPCKLHRSMAQYPLHTQSIPCAGDAGCWTPSGMPHASTAGMPHASTVLPDASTGVLSLEVPNVQVLDGVGNLSATASIRTCASETHTGKSLGGSRCVLNFPRSRTDVLNMFCSYCALQLHHSWPTDIVLLSLNLMPQQRIAVPVWWMSWMECSWPDANHDMSTQVKHLCGAALD